MTAFGKLNRQQRVENRRSQPAEAKGPNSAGKAIDRGAGAEDTSVRALEFPVLQYVTA
jgi:hypothetical protein